MKNQFVRKIVEGAMNEMLKSLNDILIFNQNHLIEMNKDRKLEKMFINFINETILK